MKSTVRCRRLVHPPNMTNGERHRARRLLYRPAERAVRYS
ncbi:hypothetical protein ABIB38_004020 [Massilia sp. UYP11]